MNEKKDLDIMQMFGLNKEMATDEKILPLTKAGVKPEKTVNILEAVSHKDTNQSAFSNYENYQKYIAVKANKQLQQSFEVRLRGDGKKHQVKLILFSYVIPAEHEIEYDGIESSTFVYGSTIYTIKGINLKWFRQNLREQKLEYIQEYDPALFNELPAENEAIIAEIQVNNTSDDD